MTLKDADEFYKPIIKKEVKVDGIVAETMASGSTGMMSVKGFITSLQAKFPITANHLMSLLDLTNSANDTLIIIKKDNTAKIYPKFPMAMLIGAKGDLKKGAIVTREHIFDISKLEFKDAVYEINLETDDKVIFLFRMDWKFGLFYDFTKKLDLEQVKEELGYCYKRLFYYDLYSFVEDEVHFNNLIADGWFPFIRLIGKDFDSIMQYYHEDKKHDFQIDDLISKFTKEKIESFTRYWWRKPLFDDKKGMLEAGINAFLQNNKNGFINCLSTLYPLIEGIMGTDYFNANGRKPAFRELKDYIKQKGEAKFNTVSSTGFPSEFYNYLTKTVFENFDLATGQLDLSRHTTCHGYANADDFNKAKALQIILILDQIYFYL